MLYLTVKVAGIAAALSRRAVPGESSPGRTRRMSTSAMLEIVPVADRGLGRAALGPGRLPRPVLGAARRRRRARRRDDEDEAEDAPGAGYRDRVVAAIVVGLLLILAGAYLAVTGRLAWSLPAFALGFGIVLALIAVNRRYRHGSPTLRRTIDLADLGAQRAALVAGILIVANVLAFRYGGRAARPHPRADLHPLVADGQPAQVAERPVTFTRLLRREPAADAAARPASSRCSSCTRRPTPTGLGRLRRTPTASVERFEARSSAFPTSASPRGGAS